MVEMPSGCLTLSFRQPNGQTMNNALKILVVEPDADVRETICSVLRELGMETTPARGVRSADAALAGGDIDLAMSEVALADGSGLALARKLRATGIPVVLMAAGPAPDSECAAVAPFLRKPFRLSRLLRIIASAAPIRARSGMAHFAPRPANPTVPFLRRIRE
jgi:DNA-binding NtrC family response regulator